MPIIRKHLDANVVVAQSSFFDFDENISFFLHLQNTLLCLIVVSARNHQYEHHATIMGFRDSAPLSDLKAPPSRPPPPDNTNDEKNHRQSFSHHQIGTTPIPAAALTRNSTAAGYSSLHQSFPAAAASSSHASSFGSGFQQQQQPSSSSYAPVQHQHQHQHQHHFMPPAPVPPASVHGIASAQQQQLPAAQFFNPNSQQQPFMVPQQQQQQQQHPSLTTALNNQPYQQQQMPGTTTTTVRGRERYCSGGAWVGPAPAWPTPPATCSVETCDFSRVKPEYAKCCETFRKRYEGLFGGNNSDSNSVSFSKKKELEVVSRKIGGLFYLMGKDIAEENGAVTQELGVKLNDLAGALERMDFGTVNAVLLDIGAKHWEEAVYWYPGLKRIVKQ